MAVKVMSIGRVCYKITGRNAGEKATIVGSTEGNEVIVRYENNRLQKCNIRHLFPTKETMKVQKVSEKELEKEKKEIAKKKKRKIQSEERKTEGKKEKSGEKKEEKK